MQKVKIPRDVADDIEKLRRVNTSNQDIIYKFAWDTENGYMELVAYAAYYFETFIQALVNGYEVEETPEDKVRGLFNTPPIFNNGIGELSTAYRNGILDTLEMLNITIKGVNDHGNS